MLAMDHQDLQMLCAASYNVLEDYLFKHAWMDEYSYYDNYVDVRSNTPGIYNLQPNYLHGQQQDAGEFLTGVMGNMCDLLTLAKR